MFRPLPIVRSFLFLFVLVGFLSEFNEEKVCANQEQNQEQNQSQSPIRFQRLYAPVDRFFLWPLGETEPYYPFAQQQFENLVSQFRTRDRTRDRDNGLTNPINPPACERLVLHASLPDSKDSRDSLFWEGTGHAVVSNPQKSVSFSPLGFWLSNPVTSDNRPLSLGWTAEQECRLFFPESDVSSKETVRFQWSLRGQRDAHGNTVFELLTPTATRIELELSIPEQWTLSCSQGIVVPPQSHERADATSSQASQRLWKVFLGGRNRATIVLSSSEKTEHFRRQFPMQQRITYHARPEGLDVTSSVLFEKTDYYNSHVWVELDSPLQVTSIQLGGRSISWDSITLSEEEENVQQLLISLPESNQSLQELTIDAVCPVHLSENWSLPRIRFRSPQHFWMETRANLFVQSPLVLCGLEFHEVSQTTATLELPTSEERGYFFQYFGPDSQITVELAPDSSRVFWDSGTAITWDEDGIRGVMLLDFDLLQKRPQLIELLVQTGWVIDSIESIPKENVLYWENDSPDSGSTDSGSTGLRTISVFVKQGRHLRISGHLASPSNKTLTLRELMPIRVKNPSMEGSSGGETTSTVGDIGLGQHLLAINTPAPNRLRVFSVLDTLPGMISSNNPSIRERFFVETPPLDSSFFVVDANSRTVQIGLEPQKTAYNAEIKGNLTLRDRELTQVYQFSCFPTEGRVDRVLVHLSQDSIVPWTWKMGNETEKNLSVEEVSYEELQGLPLPPNGQVWDIRLPTPKSGAFTFSATRTLPVDRPIPIPLAMLPESVSQQIEIKVLSAYDLSVELFNSRLKSIPTPAPPKNEYQTVRAAFRYDPARDVDLTSNPALIVLPARSEHKGTVAWVWSLQLDSLHESKGVIRQHATFFIENRGQRRIMITLPPSIGLDEVLAVWIGDKRVTWFAEPTTSLQKNDAEKSIIVNTGITSTETASVDLMNVGTEEISDHHAAFAQKQLGEPGWDDLSEETLESTKNRIFLELPEKRRFVTVALEYAQKESPLNMRRKIFPHFPEINLPVLGGTWVAWTPSPYQTFPRRQHPTAFFPELFSDNETLVLSEFNLFPRLSRGFTLGQTESVHSFDPFSLDDWNHLVSEKQQHQRCLSIATQLIAVLGDEQTLRSFKDNTDSFESKGELASDNKEETNGVLTWGNVLGTHPFQVRIFGNSAELGASRILIDWIALKRIGIFPKTPILFPEPFQSTSQGHAVLERAGLAFLFFDERNILLTSTLNAAKIQRELTPLLGDRVKMMRAGPVADQYRRALEGDLAPQWITLETWKNQGTGQVNPWGRLPRSTQLSAMLSGWSAVELKMNDSKSGLYIAQRPLLSTLCWCTLLLVALVGRIQPFSRISFLLGFLVLCAVLTQILPAYFAVIPVGAFYGTLLAIGFSLLQYRSLRTIDNQQPVPLSSLTGSLEQHESTDAAYEVRELRPFFNDVAPKTTRAFFETLSRELEDSKDKSESTE